MSDDKWLMNSCWEDIFKFAVHVGNTEICGGSSNSWILQIPRCLQKISLIHGKWTSASLKATYQNTVVWMMQQVICSAAPQILAVVQWLTVDSAAVQCIQQKQLASNKLMTLWLAHVWLKETSGLAYKQLHHCGCLS